MYTASKRTSFGVLLLSLLAATAPLQAAPPLTTFSMSIVPFDRATTVLGEADNAAIVHFDIAFRLHDMLGLDATLARHGGRLQDTTLEAHLPTVVDYTAVRNWLMAYGLSIDRTMPSRLAIGASGPVALVSRALGVHFVSIRSQGQVYIAADSPPKLPTTLASAVLGVNGLQPQLHANYQHVLRPSEQGTNNMPFLPADLLFAYRANGMKGKGAGATTAIVIDTFPLKSDLYAFWYDYGIPQKIDNITFIQTVPGVLDAMSGEETLDTEYSSSLAPASKVRIYASKTLSFANLDVAFQALIADMQAGVPITEVSISLSACEIAVPQSEEDTDDGYFAVMTALGATVFVSSGDYGAHECQTTAKIPSFFATSPHVTAAGGTALRLRDMQVVSEVGWGGSGGGISRRFSKPDYQSALPYKARAVPDLSAQASGDPGVLILFQYVATSVGGTSVSSPVLAGLIALINGERIAAGKPSLGQLNPRLYPLLGSPNLRDITVGNNGYPAGPGYDLVTGVGSPLLDILAPTLVSQP